MSNEFVRFLRADNSLLPISYKCLFHHLPVRNISLTGVEIYANLLFAPPVTAQCHCFLNPQMLK